MTSKTILVTGATGFLGSEIVKRLVCDSYTIIILKRSFSNVNRIRSVIEKCIVYDIDITSISSIFKENSVDVIFHLANSYGKNEESIENIINSNYTFPSVLLKEAIANGVSSFFNADTSLSSSLNEYTLTKSNFREMLIFNESKIDIYNLELEYFYGPGDDNWKFINFIMSSFINDIKSIDLTSGNQIRNFIYVQDVVEAYLTLLNAKKEFNGKIKNIQVGSDELISIKELVLMSKKISNNSSTILHFDAIEDRKNETKSNLCNTSFLKELGWGCKFNLNEGLRLVYENLIIK
jgi:CDP-paratose synthetase